MLNQEQTQKVNKIANRCLGILEESSRYEGVLLCEGNMDSIDVKLYRAVYPKFLVVSIGGVTDIKNLMAPMRKRLRRYPVYALIDRDSLSKTQIRNLEEEGIYCTKLPFIENIISSPEMVKMLGEEFGFDYANGFSQLGKSLMSILSTDIRNTLPINVCIEDDEPLEAITIRIKKAGGEEIETTVNESNIVYKFRSKAVANETAYLMGLRGRRQLYKFIERCLEDKYLRRKIVKCAAVNLPKIEIQKPSKNDHPFS